MKNNSKFSNCADRLIWFLKRNKKLGRESSIKELRCSGLDM